MSTPVKYGCGCDVPQLKRLVQRGVNPVVQSSIPRGRIFLLVGVIFAWLAAYCMALFRQRMARAEPLLSLHAFFFFNFFKLARRGGCMALCSGRPTLGVLAAWVSFRVCLAMALVFESFGLALCSGRPTLRVLAACCI